MTQLDLVQQAASSARAARIEYTRSVIAGLLDSADEAARAANIPDMDLSVQIHLRNLAKLIRTEAAAVTAQLDRH